MTESVKPYKFLLYAMLLLIPTYVGARVEFFLLFVAAVLIGERNTLVIKTKQFLAGEATRRERNIIVGVIFLMLFAGLNKLFNSQDILCPKDYYSPFYLFPFLLITSGLSYHRYLFLGIVVLVAGESVVGLIEYLSGDRSFLLDLGDYDTITDYSLLYNSRVYGLSYNSSILGYKILIALILIDYLRLKAWKEWSLRILLVVGLIISFSRIAILVLILYWLIKLVAINRKVISEQLFKKATIQFYGLMIFLTILFGNTLLYQSSRGGHAAESVTQADGIEHAAVGCAEEHAIPMRKAELDPAKQGWGDKLMLQAEGVQTSGRKLIWLNYINYIEQNLLFGNGSDKLMLRVWIESKGKFKLMHAHNSFLMLISSYGVLIGGLFFLFYLYFWKKINWIPVIAIVIYSMGNYGIFWGFSAMDLIFLILLSHHLKLGYEYKE
ncbi:MAG: O-antigen ligase family protein [Crocinitomicaceae bacterium]